MWPLNSPRAFVFDCSIKQTHSYAYASCVEQVSTDEDSARVPAKEEGPSEGELNVVNAYQDPNQVSEDLQTNFECEGKPRSMTYVFNLCNYVVLCLSIYVSGVDWNPSCIILGSYEMQY